MKYILIVFSLIIFQVKSYNSSGDENIISLDMIMDDIESFQVLDKEHTIKTLNDYVNEGSSTASYILAFIYYTGSYGKKVDIDKAISLLSLPVEKGNPDAKHLLGTILITYEEIDNARYGVSLLEESFQDGVMDSSINLYHAYKHDKYKNINFLSSALKMASEQGDYMATVYWGHVILDRAIAKKTIT
ncbi:SEL1-like repeat protein [Pseudoalteromonas sp. GB56]